MYDMTNAFTFHAISLVIIPFLDNFTVPLNVFRFFLVFETNTLRNYDKKPFSMAYRFDMIDVLYSAGGEIYILTYSIIYSKFCIWIYFFGSFHDEFFSEIINEETKNIEKDLFHRKKIYF